MPKGVPETVPDDGLTTRQRRNQPVLAVHTGPGKGKSTAAFGVLMRGVARERSHGLYDRTDVNIVVEDGRSYVRRSPERFGVIQATLVDTWASTAAGAFALTENNLYTVDAFREYIRHLEPDGMLSITRWEFEQPREALRLISLGMEALQEEGTADAAQHFVVVSDGALSHAGATATMLLKRSPFTRQDLMAAFVGDHRCE